MRKVAIIGGDGIGPEVISSAVDVLRYVGADLEMVSADMGQGSYRRKGAYLPQGTVDLLKECDAGLFGAITSPTTYDPSYRSPLLQLRREFDLYANVRPVKRLHPSIVGNLWVGQCVRVSIDRCTRYALRAHDRETLICSKPRKLGFENFRERILISSAKRCGLEPGVTYQISTIDAFAGPAE